jgi:hypothetical protein
MSSRAVRLGCSEKIDDIFDGSGHRTYLLGQHIWPHEVQKSPGFGQARGGASSVMCETGTHGHQHVDEAQKKAPNHARGGNGHRGGALHEGEALQRINLRRQRNRASPRRERRKEHLPSRAGDALRRSHDPLFRDRNLR